MKKFIIQITVFSFVTTACFLFVLCQADGYTDPFYVRFTTPKQESLILGNSRAAQGLQPDVLNRICNTSLYNYAFTIGNSPFGETYLNSIKKKIQKGEKAGTFIVTVDPWSISSLTENPNDSVAFREVNLCLGNTDKVNIKPNFMYLFNNLGGKYYTILINKYSRILSPMFLHQNGWLEVSMDMDSVKVSTRTNSRIKFYRTISPSYQYSSLRFHYLKKTIEFLNDFGDVYLVRLPIHPQMMEIENDFMPDFNNKIGDIIPMTKGYLDMTSLNSKFSYIDGNHLHKSSGKIVSEEIAKWINSR